MPASANTEARRPARSSNSLHERTRSPDTRAGASPTAEATASQTSAMFRFATPVTSRTFLQTRTSPAVARLLGEAEDPVERDVAPVVGDDRARPGAEALVNLHR